MDLGRLRLRLISDGTFRLDGGAMFGVVPKLLWEQQKPADEQQPDPRWRPTACWSRRGPRPGARRHRHRRQARRQVPRRSTPWSAARAGCRTRSRAAGYELERRDPRAPHRTSTSTTAAGTRGACTERAGADLPARPLLARSAARSSTPGTRTSATARATTRDNWEPLFEAGVVELFDDEAEPLPACAR